jgi:predicted outer membrane repeat protein
MLIILKKLKITLKLTAFLPLSLLVLCLLLASCYTLYPAPSGTSGTPGTGNPTAQSQPGGNTTPATLAIPPEPPPLTGTLVPGDTLTEKLAWLQRSADSHNTYILEVTANENIAPTILEYRGAINITIALRGDDENRIIRLRSNGTMFTVNSNVTFVLENNITLMGHNGNTGALVNVNGGNLKMRTGSTVTGNTGGGYYGVGGIYLASGTFEMSGGNISNNVAPDNGGGVYVQGTFTMSGGTISSNTAKGGNTCGGGGVFVGSGTFIMIGGTISENTASYGGGVRVGNIGNAGSTFNMSGGTITDNTAKESGGGVYIDMWYTFNKTGGTITGYNSDSTSGNAVRDEAGNVIARNGHAVFIRSSVRKETTAGPGVNLSYRNRDASGAWDG